MSSLEENVQESYAYYAIRGGMQALADHLAKGLTVHTGVQVAAAHISDGGWRAQDGEGRTYHARALLLTPPLPLSLAILEAGGVELDPRDRRVLAQIDYAPGLVGLFRLEGPVHIPEPGSVQHPARPVVWIANNQQKGISPSATIVTVQGSPDFSRRMWDASEIEIMPLLQEELEPYLEADTRIVQARLKRWKYAVPESNHPDACLLAVEEPPLALAGDAFGEGHIEGAALSGLAAAQALAARL